MGWGAVQRSAQYAYALVFFWLCSYQHEQGSVGDYRARTDFRQGIDHKQRALQA